MPFGTRAYTKRNAKKKSCSTEKLKANKYFEFNYGCNRILIHSTNQIKLKQIVNTKILMIASSVYLGISGLALTFLPEEIAEYLNGNINQSSILFLQILGSLYLGFAMLNWMSKNNLIGGIYSKPLIIGNLGHFFMSSFALIKIIGQYSENEFLIILAITIIYCAFTLCFGYIFITNPSKIKDTI